MSRYAANNPESWDYMNPAPAMKRSYRADTIEPTESAGEWASKIAGAAGAKPCTVCGTLTFGVAHGDPLCADCQAKMADDLTGAIHTDENPHAPWPIEPLCCSFHHPS